MTRGAGRAALLAALVSLSPVRAGGDGSPPPEGGVAPAAEAQPARRGIILMTVDSLRTDRLFCYAGGDVRSPGMDSVARAGIRFERAYTASVSTAASVATVMTGLEPAGHGLRGNYHDRLDAGTPTLAERLHAAGWATSAVIGTQRLDSERGLSRGFDRYDEEIGGIRKKLNVMSKERRASDVAERGLVALDALPKDRPFFLWLHFHDPDWDYDPPEAQKQGHEDSPYDGEVAAVDAAIDAVVVGARNRAPGGRLTFVLAGTHGEGLGDHQETGHGFYLHETTVRVPLLFVPEGTVPAAGRTERAPVGLVDVAPTLLAIAGAPALDRTDGRPLTMVTTPQPAEAPKGKKTAGSRQAPPRRIYMEAAAPYLEYGWSPLAGIVEGDRKVVVAPGGRVEAFDLAADPTGSSALPKAPRWAADLAREAVQRLGSLDPPEDRRREVAAAAAEFDFPWGNSPFCAEKMDFPDPRDPERVARSAQLYQARFDFDLGYFGYSGNVALKMVDDEPANPAVLEFLAVFGLRTHWGDMLLEPLEILTCNFPYRIDGYHYLGHFYVDKRDFPKALAAFRLMTIADPLDEEAEYDVACTYAAMGQKDEAFEHLRRSIALGAHEWDLMRRDGRLAPLHNDPRFAELVPAPGG